MPRNQGEKYEVFLKAFLYIMFKTKQPLVGSHGIDLITSLKFSSDGYLPKWDPKYLELLSSRDYEALKDIFPKAPTGSKADLEINGVKYSVKSSMGARAAIVNHTNRAGFLRVCNLLHIDIGTLDNMINVYWKKRIRGIIKEDISNSDPESPFKDSKEYLRPIIEYFLFVGTGTRHSIFPADKVLVFSEPEETVGYKIYNKNETFNIIWDELVFSVRSKKGMPILEKDGKKINMYKLPEHSDLEPWVRYFPENAEFPKGALHIRY